MGFLGHMAVLFLIFKVISTLFSIVVVLVCIPTNSEEVSLFSIPSPAFIACRLLDRSHSDWREMVPHGGFDLHFSDSEWQRSLTGYCPWDFPGNSNKVDCH